MSVPPTTDAAFSDASSMIRGQDACNAPQTAYASFRQSKIVRKLSTVVPSPADFPFFSPPFLGTTPSRKRKKFSYDGKKRENGGHALLEPHRARHVRAGCRVRLQLACSGGHLPCFFALAAVLSCLLGPLVFPSLRPLPRFRLTACVRGAG